MWIAVDIDGTVDSAPSEMESIMSALKACGHRVTILTGTQMDQATAQDFTDKANFLNALGCGQCWDDLTVLASPDGDVAPLKAQWLASNGVDVLIDNDKQNARAASAAGVKLVLVPWASRQ